MKPAASKVRGSVTGSRLTISRPTGTSYWIEVPRSPRTAPASHSTYWTSSGRSRPSDRRSRSSVSGFRSTPRISSAGSPGNTRTTTKTRAETNRRVTANAVTLLKRYRFTGAGGRPLSRCRPAHLGQVGGRDRQILPEARHTLLGRHQARMDEEEYHRRVFHLHLLQLCVLFAAGLVVEGHLGLLVQLLKLRAVVPVVVLRVGIVRDVPRLGVADDGQVVVGFLPHAREPLPPLDLLDLHLHADLVQLVDDDLARAHGVVVLRSHLEDGLEPVRIAGLGEQLLGPGGIVGDGLGQVDEVRIQGVDVGADDATHAE